MVTVERLRGVLTMRKRYLPILFVLGVVVIAAAGAQAAGAVPDAQPAVTTAPLPADAGPADVVLGPLLPGPGMISGAVALAIAAQVAPVDSASKVEASLVLASDPTILDPAIDAKPIWLIHLSGMAYPVSIVPFGLKAASVADLTNEYIYIDAYTGEWLISRFEN